MEKRPLVSLPIRLHPDGAERLPLSDLLLLGQSRLMASRVLERAARSSVYAARWRKVGVQPVWAQDADRWQGIPFTRGEDLQGAQHNGPLGRFFVGQPRLWVSSASRGTARKWIPFGDEDLCILMGLTLRMAETVGIYPADRVLAIIEPSPRIGNPLPYLWGEADDLEGGLHLEFIPGSMAMLEHNNWPAFAPRRRPTVFWSSREDALTLRSTFVEANGPGILTPAEAMPNLRVGLFFGGPLDPVRETLERAYGLEAFSLYFLAEAPVMAVECSAHAGMHLWMDACLPELIPLEELEREKRQPGSIARALPLVEAAEGTEGELVLTTFGQALPLVRYRTGDRIRLVSASPCACGRTHPRILVLGRIKASI